MSAINSATSTMSVLTLFIVYATTLQLLHYGLFFLSAIAHAIDAVRIR